MKERLIEKQVVREVQLLHKNGVKDCIWPDAPICKTLAEFLEWLNFIETGITRGEIVKETSIYDVP